MKPIKQHKWQRALVAFSVLAVLFCSSLCMVEAFAESHLTSSDHKSDHDCSHQKAACCTDLLAADSVLKNIVSFDLVKNSLYPHDFSLDPQRQVKSTTEHYLIDFSPGQSPPAFFLSSHTSHAPPLS